MPFSGHPNSEGNLSHVIDAFTRQNLQLLPDEFLNKKSICCVHLRITLMRLNILRESRFTKRQTSGTVSQLHTAGYFPLFSWTFTREPSPHPLGAASQIFLYNIVHFINISLLQAYLHTHKNFYQNTPHTLHASPRRKEYKLSHTESVKYFNPHGEMSSLFFTTASNQASPTTKYHLNTWLLMQSHTETLLLAPPPPARFRFTGK